MFFDYSDQSINLTKLLWGFIALQNIGRLCANFTLPQSDTGFFLPLLKRK